MKARQTTRSGEVLNGIAAQAGQKFLSLKVTLTTDPLVLNFAGAGLPDMADTDYRVMLSGEFATAQGTTSTGTYVDEGTIATTGFSIVGGTGAEVAHLLIHGNVAE